MYYFVFRCSLPSVAPQTSHVSAPGRADFPRRYSSARHGGNHARLGEPSEPRSDLARYLEGPKCRFLVALDASNHIELAKREEAESRQIKITAEAPNKAIDVKKA
jgi:hypothetical protein